MTSSEEVPGSSIAAFLEQGVRDGVTPGAVALVAAGEQVLARCSSGDAQVVPDRHPMGTDTVFDLASLSKPLVTATLAVLLARELDLRPDRPAVTLLPELSPLDHADITLRHLLAHAAGFPAWRPLFLRAEGAGGYLRELRDEPLTGRPGAQVVYSDPSYMAAGEMVARAAGSRLDRLFQEVIAGPLGLAMTFNPGPELAARTAATEEGQEYERVLAGVGAEGYTGWRTWTLRGEVHDHHTWVAGGVLGSAGLFGTADDLHRLALLYLEPEGRLDSSALERLRSLRGPEGEEARSEGFALNTAGAGSCGSALPETAFGHTGFTGTSLWIDPERSRIYVLLTNRIHPRVGSQDIAGFRREFHRIAAEI